MNWGVRIGYVEEKENIEVTSNSMKKLQDLEFPDVSRKLVNPILCFVGNILCSWRKEFGGWENRKCLRKRTLRA